MQTVEFTKISPMSSTMRESLRALRTNIQFCGDDIRTILFTSTVPNEGKSTVVLDLARSIGESGKHVLLIDTDMRKSVIMQEYSVKSAAHRQILGLSHYLSGQNTASDHTCCGAFPDSGLEKADWNGTSKRIPSLVPGWFFAVSQIA